MPWASMCVCACAYYTCACVLVLRDNLPAQISLVVVSIVFGKSYNCEQHNSWAEVMTLASGHLSHQVFP